jgi:acetylornithine deacetylase/succinyl-diaminopimelate desuccinylase-like protein
MGDLQASAISLLQRLIRFDTVNPPGNERPAQEFLAGLLGDVGFETTLVGAEPDRPNLVARLRGAEEGPRLALLSHVDTVLATPEEWTHDPWSGELADGCVWGRGALDMKSQTACEVAAALELAGSGWRPAAGDLLVVVLADEETGGSLGAQWICEHHPDLVRADYVLNEGAGAHFEYDGARRYGVCVAEKGVFRFRLRTAGVAGHASYPKMGDNARSSSGSGRGSRASTSRRRRPRCWTAWASRSMGTLPPRSSSCARATRGSPPSSSRCSA